MISENTSHSYDVETHTGHLRRNERHLISLPANETIVEEQSNSQILDVNNSDVCKIKSGLIVKPSAWILH